MTSGGEALRCATEEQKASAKFVLEAVKLDWEALRYADPKLCDKEEIVLTAVEQDGQAILLAGAQLLENRDFLLKAVTANWVALKHAPKSCQRDREIVLEAVKQDGWALQFAHKELRKDPEFLREAVRENWPALLYASDGLKLDIDREMLIEVAKKFPRNQGDHEFVQEAADAKQSGTVCKLSQIDAAPLLHCANWPYVRPAGPTHRVALPKTPVRSQPP